MLDLPRTSEYYTIANVVWRFQSDTEMSDVETSRIVSACNELWEHAAGAYPEPAQRVTAIFDKMFEEINATVLLQTKLGSDDAAAKKDREDAQDTMSGIVPAEDYMFNTPDMGGKPNEMRRSTLRALKNIAVSVFDIVNRIGISEDRVAGDYKDYIERLQKRIGDTKEAERFGELVKAFREPSKGVGEVQHLFLAFSEFVVTPLFAMLSVVEGYVYRASNLYLTVVRQLLRARIEETGPPVRERKFWDKHGAAVNAQYTNQLRKVLESIKDGTLELLASHDYEKYESFEKKGGKLRLPMYQPT